MSQRDLQCRDDFSYRFIMGVGFAPADEHLLHRAWLGAALKVPLRFVRDPVAALALLQAVEAMPSDSLQMPALILLDIDANPLSTLDALKALRSRHAFREVVIMLCASSWNPEIAKRGYALGADSCADKGPDFAEVIRLLRRLEEFWFPPSLVPEHA